MWKALTWKTLWLFVAKKGTCSLLKLYSMDCRWLLLSQLILVKLSFLCTSICFFFPIFFRTLHHLSCFKNVPFSCRYDYYSFSVIPAVGELVAGDRDSYQYLVESIRRFPPQVIILSYVLLQILPQSRNPGCYIYCYNSIKELRFSIFPIHTSAEPFLKIRYKIKIKTTGVFCECKSVLLIIVHGSRL